MTPRYDADTARGPWWGVATFVLLALALAIAAERHQFVGVAVIAVLMIPTTLFLAVRGIEALRRVRGRHFE